MFSVISSIKLRRFWWNLVHHFLNKPATKLCKCFPPHLNNVSTLPCKTWNAHQTRATSELSKKEIPEFIPPQLWPPNSWDLNTVHYSVWELLQEKVYKIHITDLNELKKRPRTEWAKLGQVIISAAICQWRHSRSVSSRSVCFVYHLVQYFPNPVINWIQIWRIWRPQLRWDKFWSFYLTTHW